MLRGFLLLVGGGIAVVLSAGAAAAAILTVTYAGPANPTTATPLTWTVGQNNGSPTSCELTFGGATVRPLADCGPTVTYSVAGQPAGTYTLVVHGDAVANINPGTKTASSSVGVAPVAPSPSGPAGPSSSRAPRWSLGLPGGAVGACSLTNAGGTVVAAADPCPDPWTGDLSGAADGVYTLTVTARQAGMTSAPATLTYRLDTTAPTAATLTPPASPGNDRTPTFEVAGVEAGAGVACTATGPNGAVSVAACSAGSARLALTGEPDGAYQLSVVVTDAAGNTSPSATAGYTLDATPAPAPAVSAPPALTRQTSVTLTIDDSEAGVALTCRLTSPRGATVSSGACPANGTFATAGYGDGVYTLVVTATDAAGNPSSTTVTWQRDTTPPPAPVVTGASAPTKDRTPTLAVTDTEPGVTYTCATSGPSAASFTSCGPSTIVDLSAARDGDYIVMVTATDAAGNSRSTSVTLTLDTIAPPAPVVTAPAGPVNNRTPTLAVSDTEASVAYSCFVSGAGATVQSCGASTTIDLTPAADGSFDVTVTATDAAGNSRSTTVSVTLDTSAPPAPSVSAPPSLTRSRALVLTVDDTEPGVTLTCVLTAPGGATVSSGPCPAGGTFDTTGFGDGDYALVVTATDAAGNAASTSVGWTRDATAPPAPDVSAPAALTRSSSVTLSVSDTEPGVTVTCVLTAPGGAVVRRGLCPGGGVFDTTGFGDGHYTLRVTATDAAGNSSSTTVTWTRDTVAPPAAAVIAPRSPARNRTPGFSVTDAESGVTYVCTVTGPSAATVTSCGPTTRLNLPGADGTYTVTVNAIDAAGNVSATTTATFLLDTTAPPAPTLAVTPSPAQGPSASFGISGVEPVGLVTCTLSGPAGSTVTVPGSCAPGVTLDLTGQPDGSYTLTVTVTDTAGNVSTAALATYVIDTTSPAAPAVTPPANPANDTTPTFDIVTESGAQLTCTVSRFFQTVWTGPCPADGTLDLTGYADGEFEVTVFATDAAGNVGPSATAVYLLDTAAPDLPVLTAPASPSPMTRPDWRWTSEPGTAATCTLTNSAGTVVVGPVACTSPWTADLVGLPDDTYTFSVVVTDPAGNASPAATSVFVLDRQAPVPPVVVPPASPDNDLTPTWHISGPRNAQLMCTLLQGRQVIWGSTACPADGTFSLAGLPDGTYTLRVTAVDHAGNTSAVAVTTYVLDTTPPPAPTLDYGSPSPSTVTAPFWGFTLPPGTTGRCQLLSGGAVLATRNSCSGAVRFDLAGRPEGTYVVKIWAVDAAGNVSQPLAITYVLGHASPVPASSGGTGSGSTGGPPPSPGRHPGGHQPPTSLPTAPGAARQATDELNRLSGLIQSGVKHTVQKVATAASAIVPAIHDKITEHVAQAVQGVVNAVSSAGGGTGFPLILLLVVLAFLLVQNRIDSRDPKLALASVVADDTVEFLPPPSRGGNR